MVDRLTKIWIKMMEKKYKVDLSEKEKDLMCFPLDYILKEAIMLSDIVEDKAEEIFLMNLIMSVAGSKVGLNIMDTIEDDILYLLDDIEENVIEDLK